MKRETKLTRQSFLIKDSNLTKLKRQKSFVFVFFILVLILYIPFAKSQVVVNNLLSPSQLANNVFAGSGIQVSNVSFTGTTNSMAQFNCNNNCGLGMNSGILITNGNAFIASGPNTVSSAGQNNGLPGDPNLNQLVSPFITRDASVLEFDFTSISDTVKFNFIYASEEYNDQINTFYHDVFAFLLYKPGSLVPINLAVLPGTTTEINSSTVNNGFASAGQNATGPCNNCSYYRDNANPVSASINCEYDGFTTVLTASAAVLTCETYHLKIVIADVGDFYSDAGVFLEAGSFKSGTPITVNADTSLYAGTIINDTLWICPGDTTVLCASNATSYSWSTGATTQCIEVSGAGNYFLQYNSGNCTYTSNVIIVAVDSMIISAYPTGTVSIPVGGTVIFCVTGGQSVVWSTGDTSWCIDVTIPGTYTATITSPAGCTVTKVFQGTGGSGGTGGGSPSIYVNVSSNTVLCAGSKATLTAHAVNFTALGYLWSTGATTQSIVVTTGGNYVVTVNTIFGITLSGSFSISVVNPSASISGNNGLCPGQTANLQAMSGPNYSYLWSTGSTNSSIIVGPGTYTLSATDQYGCPVIDTHTVNALPAPTPVVTGNNSICSGTTTILTVTQAFPSYSWNSGQNTQSINVDSTAYYRVIVTANNGCTGTDSMLVIAHPAPTVNLSGSNIICNGANTLLTAGAGFASYLWSNGATTGSISVSTPATYTVTVTDVYGCTNHDSITLRLNNFNPPTISGPNEICAGTAAGISTGTGFAQYQWSNGSSTVSTVVGPGMHYVIVTDQNACTSIAYKQISSMPNPVPNIVGSNNICTGDTSVLNAGTGFTGYLWNSGATTQTIQAGTSALYSVTVIDTNGCTGSDQYYLIVRPVPAANISGPGGICSGDSAHLIAAAGFSTYLWSDGSTNRAIYVTAAATYTVTVSDSYGCTGTDSVSMNVHTLPVPQINGPDTICDSTTARLQSTAVFSGYHWSTGAISSSITITPGTYILTVTDQNGCTASVTKTVEKFTLPYPVIMGIDSICRGDTAILDAGQGYDYYNWSTGDTTQLINATNNNTYTVVVTDANGCTGSDTFRLTVVSLPTPVITGPANICEGDTALIKADPGYSSYLWSNGSSTHTNSVSAAGTYTLTVSNFFGCSANAHYNLNINQNPQPSITGPEFVCKGSFIELDAGSGFASYIWSDGSTTQIIQEDSTSSYIVTVVDNKGCKGESGIHHVMLDIPIAYINPNGNLHICPNEPITLKANTGSSYLWSDGSTNSQLTVNNDGNYFVSVSDSLGCIAISDSVEIVRHFVPDVSIVAERLKTCKLLSYSFKNKTEYPGSFMFEWNFGDGVSSILKEPKHTFRQPGQYMVSLRITTGFGCVEEDTVEIYIILEDDPIAEFDIFGDVPPLFEGGVQFADLSVGAVTWHWQFEKGSFSEKQNPYHYFNREGKHTVRLTVENGIGCRDTYEKEILIGTYFIPNSFTPNGDGINDTYFLADYIYGNTSSFKMDVFDRWGNLVYRAEDCYSPWDGYVKGVPANEDAYIYNIRIITKGGHPYEYIGHLTLIR